MEDIQLRFGEGLRKRRNKRGVSQEEFADICGLDRTYIGGIERGERNSTLINIEKIAQALKISLPELFREV
jgi:transcriptional regulator with XRE-family HTH domain